MPTESPTFAILITTKDRVKDLSFTLDKIQSLIKAKGVEIVIFDDGSHDNTFNFVKDTYPQITIYRNEVSKGYLFCRNKMLNTTKAEFAISLDDDAHFISEKPLEYIKDYFKTNQTCGVIAFRIFWGLEEPRKTFSDDISKRVQGFVGCGHVWRMKAWKDIPDYPEWFVFYGEEDFAAFHLFKKDWEVHYSPEVLIQHRVNIKSRKKDNDYAIRLRRSLRSGWYLIFMFYPLKLIPKKFLYSIWIQLKHKVFKGDMKALKAIVLAIFDLTISILKIIKNSNRLSNKQFKIYHGLTKTKIY